MMCYNSLCHNIARWAVFFERQPSQYPPLYFLAENCLLFILQYHLCVMCNISSPHAILGVS